MPEDNNILAAALLGQQRQRERANPYERMARYGNILMQQGSSTAPVQSPLEGLARALQGGVGGYFAGQAETQQREEDAANYSQLAKAASAKSMDELRDAIGGLKGDSATFGPALAMLIGERQKQLQAGVNADAFRGAYGGSPPAQGTPSAAPSGVPQPATGEPVPLPGIPGFESGNKYDAIGPVTTYPDGTKDRPWGKYQVMGKNIAPWTQSILGKAMTDQEFLNDPKAQDAVYAAKIKEYRQLTGSDQGAASMWFSGQKNPNSQAKDVNGVSVQQYVQRTVGGQPQVAQGSDTPPVRMAQADASGTPVAPATGSEIPDVPRPQPTQAQLDKYDKLVRSGDLTAAQARQALDQEVTQEWTVQRENRRMSWQTKKQEDMMREQKRLELEQKAPMELLQKRMDVYETKTRPKAEAAVTDIQAIHTARQLVDAGAFTGAGANAQLMLGKLGELVGLKADETANTQVLMAQLANRVIAGLGGSLGTGFSNADRDFFERAKAGQINWTEDSLRKMFDIGERESRNVLKNHDSEVARLMKGPGVAQLGSGFFEIPQAQTYEEWSKANPLKVPQAAQPSQPQAASQSGAVAQPKSKEDYDALPSGTPFIAPDGTRRTKP